ncbi:hypothetical protein SAMN05443572_11452 [Myxococcus fulvus]|uniref:Tetratricopeptide repeat protein n=2 Tax=Myxococcus fulvus TaxID=33 RepID=A0ABY1CWW2_MYXFU|nr:hypothetical protein SAMN05443572_11452 [Myxococcus fulvus]
MDVLEMESISMNRLCAGWARRAGVGVLLLGLCLLPFGARAEVSPDVKRYLLSIHRLVEDLEHERALEQIARAKKVSKGPEDDVAVSLYEGVVLAELSRGKEEADAAFQAALFLDPEAKLPMAVSPKLRTRFEAVRQKVLAELAARGERPMPLRTEAGEGAGAPVDGKSAAGTSDQVPPGGDGVLSERAVSPRERAWIPAAVGGALAAGGGVMWWLASREESKLDDPSPDIRSRDDARKVASRARSLQTVSVGLLVGGVVGLGVGTGMYLLGAPRAPLALTVGTDGTSAFVSGRWP